MPATASEQPSDVAPVELHELYRRHRGELVRLAALLVGDEGEEVVQCVVLRYYLDLPESEIASWLGISQGSVKTHLHRAVSSLASRLEELDQ